jgi:hypothetical protein
MNHKGFDRRLDRLIEKIKDWTVPTDFLATPEWKVIHATILEAVQPFPDAELAVFRAFAQIEQGSHDWKSIEDVLYRALGRYADARVAIAEATIAIEKESNGSPKLPA